PWLSDLLRRSLQFQRPAAWNESLIAAAHSIVTGEAAGASDKVSADLRAALGSKSLMQTTAAVRATAWDIISGVGRSDDGMTRAAAQGTALAYLLRDASNLRFGSVTVDDVARLLQGVARSLRYWAWDTEPRTTNSALAHWDVESAPQAHTRRRFNVMN